VTAFTGALGNSNRLKLGTFSTNVAYGGFITTLEGTLRADWSEMKRVAELTDRMGLEAIISVARWKGYGGTTNFSGPSFDTFCWAAGVAAATEYAHVFTTVHVPTIHPIVAAKQLTTIDHTRAAVPGSTWWAVGTGPSSRCSALPTSSSTTGGTTSPTSGSA
jgi:alkanesulfonate monooxygenase SsuD/methylene tetrahydromethanopterin reductase-like flavin-dependent oxidoreductase (luciferase family)